MHDVKAKKNKKSYNERKRERKKRERRNKEREKKASFVDRTHWFRKGERDLWRQCE